MAIEIEITEFPPPLLEFGSPGEFTDQKEGLMQAGPFDLRFGSAHRPQVRIGVVGPSSVVENAVKWIEKCKKFIPSEMENIQQYPPFPGFKDTFRSDLVLEDRWIIEFDENKRELERALKQNPRERFEQVLELYSKGIRKLATSEIKPDVVICCLPETVIRLCWSISRELSRSQRNAIKKNQKIEMSIQPSLFENIKTEETTEDLLYRDFRRALKAQAMKAGMPIQIGRDRLFVDSRSNQDAATRAWNMSVALYYKAGGIPWRIKNNGPETCFVGISFHHIRTTHRHMVRSSIAQAFSTEGDGFALRGDTIPWNPKKGRDVHLSEEQAERLAERVLTQYQELSGGSPLRIVLHKTSKFNEEELSGFKRAFRNIPIIEPVNIAPSMFRLVQFGQYPPRRGTFCRVNKEKLYLFTSGYMPEWKTYPGPHIPTPLKLNSSNDNDVYSIASDILSLTRMNWNTAQNTNSHPVTLRFAREVGGIMAEVKEGEEKPSYRYYM